jgi:hypothetical protein
MFSQLFSNSRLAPPHSGTFPLFSRCRGVAASDLFRSQVIIGGCFCQNFLSLGSYYQHLPFILTKISIIIKYYFVLFLPYLHPSRRSFFDHEKWRVANLLVSAAIIAKFVTEHARTITAIIAERYNARVD